MRVAHGITGVIVAFRHGHGHNIILINRRSESTIDVRTENTTIYVYLPFKYVYALLHSPPLSITAPRNIESKS